MEAVKTFSGVVLVLPTSGFHRVDFEKGDWGEDKDGEPGPEFGNDSSEDFLSGEEFAEKADDEGGGGDGEADCDGGFHRFGVAADQDGQADEQHNDIHNGVCNSEMFLAVKEGEVL